MRIQEMGLVKKMRKLPFDMSKERVKEPSTISLMIKPMIKGAPSYLNFLIKKPRIPKMSMIIRSGTAFFMV